MGSGCEPLIFPDTAVPVLNAMARSIETENSIRFGMQTDEERESAANLPHRRVAANMNLFARDPMPLLLRGC